VSRHRSLKHIGVLGASSGLIALVVVVTDASRVWLAAGPALLGVLDAAVFSGPAARAARWAARAGRRPGGGMRTLVSWEPASTLYQWDGVPSLLRAVPIAVLIAIVGAGSVAGVPLWVRLALAVPAVFLLGGFGRLGFMGILPLHAERPEKAETVVEVFIAAASRDARFVLLGLEVPDDQAGGMDAILSHARAAALSSRAGGADPVICRITVFAARRSVVLADASTRAAFLKVLRKTPAAAALSVGEATYPDDGDSAAELVAAAFAKTRPLTDS